MNYHGFVIAIKEEVKKRVGEDMVVTIEKTIKNNGVILDGLVIRDKRYNACPVHYLNSYYEGYQEHGDLERYVNEILMEYEENKLKGKLNFSQIIEWAKMKDKVRMTLINKELNKRALFGMPYQEFLDLAVVFYIEVENSKLGQASIKVTNPLFHLWEISYEELYRTAYENMIKYSRPKIIGMSEVIKDMINLKSDGIEGEYEELMKDLEEPDSMYILSSENKIKGAGSLLCKKVLKEFAKDINQDFYILPSSIHELVLVPDDGSYQLADFEKMVKEVNIKEVNEEEMLSEKVYYFNRERAEVYIA